MKAFVSEASVVYVWYPSAVVRCREPSHSHTCQGQWDLGSCSFSLKVHGSGPEGVYCLVPPWGLGGWHWSQPGYVAPRGFDAVVLRSVQLTQRGQ